MKALCLFLAAVLTACGSASSADGNADHSANGGASPGLAGRGGGGGSSSTAGGSSGSAVAPDASPLPSVISIDVVGALVGPAKSNGAEWDTPGSAPTVIEAVSTLAGQPEIGPLLSYMQSAAIGALSAPDPYGIAELDPTGAGFDQKYTINLATRDEAVQDAFNILWPAPTPGWRGVPFHAGIKVRITVHDEDISDDDDIGEPTITYDDLLAAWKAQDTYWVRVGDQTANQLLAVSIVVSGVAN